MGTSVGIVLIINSLFLGVGLAMDAFSVSIANGLEEPSMKKGRVCLIAGVFALFQFAMPVAGWFLVCSVAELFRVIRPFIPWVSLILLCFIGGKMIFEGLSKKTPGDKEVKTPKKLTFGVLILQGIATSIDALSVGFTIVEYSVLSALVSSVIIGAVTFVICLAGLVFGRKLGEKFSDKATVAGGVILIVIGIEIFIKSFI